MRTHMCYSAHTPSSLLLQICDFCLFSYPVWLNHDKSPFMLRPQRQRTLYRPNIRATISSVTNNRTAHNVSEQNRKRRRKLMSCDVNLSHNTRTRDSGQVAVISVCVLVSSTAYSDQSICQASRLICNECLSEPDHVPMNRKRQDLREK